jgi:hypothetical protein
MTLVMFTIICTLPAVTIAIGGVLVIPPVFAQEEVTCQGVPATKVGTANGETITGTPGRDVIAALGGDDTIDALGGDDLR